MFAYIARQRTEQTGTECEGRNKAVTAIKPYSQFANSLETPMAHSSILDWVAVKELNLPYYGYMVKNTVLELR